MNSSEANSRNRQFENIKSSEPAFAEIIKSYLGKENINSHYLSDWEHKIKKAAFFPTLYLGYDHQLRETQSLSVTDNISISSGNVTVGPSDNNTDFDNNLAETFHVRAIWSMDEMIFNHNQFALAKEKRDLINLKANLTDEIFKIYDQRYQCLIQYLTLKVQASSKAMAFYAKYLTLTDRLDEITNREFTKRFWREK